MPPSYYSTRPSHPNFNRWDRNSPRFFPYDQGMPIYQPNLPPLNTTGWQTLDSQSRSSVSRTPRWQDGWEEFSSNPFCWRIDERSWSKVCEESMNTVEEKEK